MGAGSEAPDPHGAATAAADTYAEDMVVLVCRRCGHRKHIIVEDFHGVAGR